jgi:hypothetical protein
MSALKPSFFQRIANSFQAEHSPSDDRLVELRIKSAVESILENEALTDGLDDQAAQVMLEWGRMTAQSIARQGGADMDARLRSLRLLLRAINRWVSSQPLEAHADQHPVLGEILEQAAILYGRSIPVDRQTMPATLIKAVGPTPDSANLITALLSWLDQSTPKE